MGSLASSAIESPERRPEGEQESALSSTRAEQEQRLTVRNQSINLLRPVLLQRLRRQLDRSSRIRHVIDQDRNLVLDISDEQLHLAFRVGAVAFRTVAVDQGKVAVETVGEVGRAVKREG
jgi:hypothetical protein